MISFKSSGIKSDSNIFNRKIKKKPAGIVTPVTFNDGNDGIIKTRFNPDQIVDIVTFIEHPYFCNLKPYPWQKLILKCFFDKLFYLRLSLSRLLLCFY